MRSNLILSIFLTTVIANPVIRRANQAENANSIIDIQANADNVDNVANVANVANVVDDGKTGKSLPVGGKELTDLELKEKIEKLLAIKKAAGKLPEGVEVSSVLAKIKNLVSLKKATSLTDGELLSILDKVLGVEVKAEGEDLKLGSEAEEGAGAEGSGK